jgi:hypothetical protein
VLPHSEIRRRPKLGRRLDLLFRFISTAPSFAQSFFAW